MSKYGIFIIENLHEGDFWDGLNLHDILNLSMIKNIYRVVNNKYEFAKAVDEFKISDLRYLHISCHANMDGIEIGGEEISNLELHKILKNRITKRRIFFSACNGGNRNIATAIHKSEGQSVIGTPVELYFDKAALFWPAFYHVINLADSRKMNSKSISRTLKKCVDIFEIPINYYHGINGENRIIQQYEFRPNSTTIISKIALSKLK